MLAVIALSALVSRCTGSPLSAVWLNPIAPLAPLGQYQTRDGPGSYHHYTGYAGAHDPITDSRFVGTINGGYPYVDANGLLQTFAYLGYGANDYHRLGGTEITEEERPVAAEEDNDRRNGDQDAETRRDDPLALRRIGNGETRKEIPLALGVGVGVGTGDTDIVEKSGEPILVVDRSSIRRNGGAIPPRYVVPLNYPYRLMHSSLRHTQDSLGQYDYSYAGDTSAKTESRSLDGTTRGAYSYVDPNGLLQQVHYIADRNGFRVAATNLPEAK